MAELNIQIATSLLFKKKYIYLCHTRIIFNSNSPFKFIDDSFFSSRSPLSQQFKLSYLCPKPLLDTIFHIIYAPTSNLHITLNHIHPPLFQSTSSSSFYKVHFQNVLTVIKLSISINIYNVE